MPRSGGSTELTYVDMAKRPHAACPRARDEQPTTIPAPQRALALFLELWVGEHAAAAALRLRSRLEVRVARRLRQRGRRRRLAPRLGIAGRCRRRLARRGAGEAGPLLLKMHAQPGELPLDLANRLLPLVEPLALGLGEGELLHGLALALFGLRDLARELVRAVRPGGGGDGRRGGVGRVPPTLSAGDAEAQLVELFLARGDALRVLAQRPLHLLDLRERLLVAAAHVQRFAHTGSVSSIAAGGNRLVS